MKEVLMPNGKISMVDDQDFELVSEFNWHMSKGGYVRRRVKCTSNERKYDFMFMHRFIMGLAKGDKSVIDHIDGNKLNNQRSNLRICSAADNSRNRRKNKTNKIGFKGIGKSGKSRYRASIKFNYKSIYLGVFDTPEEAHKAYCEAASRLYGEFASNGEPK